MPFGRQLRGQRLADLAGRQVEPRREPPGLNDSEGWGQGPEHARAAFDSRSSLRRRVLGWAARRFACTVAGVGPELWIVKPRPRPDPRTPSPRKPAPIMTDNYHYRQ